MKELGRFVGEMEYDGLIAGLNPPAVVGGGVLAALSEDEEASVYKRGTILAKSAANGQLYILGREAAQDDTLTPDCILCDDTELGSVSTAVAVYLAGCFNTAKLIMDEGYTMTEADKDALRMRGIMLKAVAE